MRLMHVGLHDSINQNAGDTLLFWAIRKCFDFYFDEPIDWGLKQLWEPFSADEANAYDGVIVGGGGLFLPDQDGAHYEASGWQWNCPLAELEALNKPLVLFAIGKNLFRGQADFSSQFYTHIQAVAKKTVFTGMRERYAAMWLHDVTSHVSEIYYQPCPTTVLFAIGAAEPRRIDNITPHIGVNFAGDRLGHRFRHDRDMRDLMHGLLHACAQYADQGVTPVFLHHKPCDKILLQDAMVLDADERTLYAMSPENIMQTYLDLHGIIGMRGHAALIACGLELPFLSLISHDKLTYFLDDINHAEWGVDIANPGSAVYRIREFFAAYQRGGKRVARYKQFVRHVQRHLAQITKNNMHIIRDRLGG